MERKQLRNTVSDLIILRSDRVTFHPMLITPRDQIPPLLANNLEFVAVDAKPHRCFVVCKHCHTVFYNESWNRPIIMNHLIRFHGIEQTDGKLKTRVRKSLQPTKLLPNEHTCATPTPTEHTFAPPTQSEHDSEPPTPMEASPSPSLGVKISNLRKPSQEVILPQASEARKLSQEVTVPEDTETNALTKLEAVPDKKPTAKKRSQRRKPAKTTLDTDQLPLANTKPTAKKMSKRHKPSSDNVPLKKRSGRSQAASSRNHPCSRIKLTSNLCAPAPPLISHRLLIYCTTSAYSPLA